jgi:hypothetical protein
MASNKALLRPDEGSGVSNSSLLAEGSRSLMLVEEFGGDVEEARVKTAGASAGVETVESLSAASKVASVSAGKGSIWEMRNMNYGSACN